MADSANDSAVDPEACTAEAVTLLLRSPQWSVSDVMELLEIGDSEFRLMIERHSKLARVLAERKASEGFDGVNERQCANCGDTYRTATFRNHCGAPACREIARLERTR